jgi:hypothetical protein
LPIALGLVLFSVLPQTCSNRPTTTPARARFERAEYYLQASKPPSLSFGLLLLRLLPSDTRVLLLRSVIWSRNSSCLISPRKIPQDPVAFATPFRSIKTTLAALSPVCFATLRIRLVSRRFSCRQTTDIINDEAALPPTGPKPVNRIRVSSHRSFAHHHGTSCQESLRCLPSSQGQV